MDSSGVAALIAVKKHFADGDIRVVASRDPARRLLDRLALNDYLGAYNTAEEAAKTLLIAG
jgi:anti-anti-sigma regulatory factor